MGDLVLKGTALDLSGNLSLNPNGGKLLIGDAGLEALVELPAAVPPQGSAPPVIMPPPPAAPLDPAPGVWIINSFNKTVKAGAAQYPLAALGMVMQGKPGAPTWPGMLLPSSGNPGVTINGIAINVVNDQAVIFPSGGSASFTGSGQQ